MYVLRGLLLDTDNKMAVTYLISLFLGILKIHIALMQMSVYPTKINNLSTRLFVLRKCHLMNIDILKTSNTLPHFNALFTQLFQWRYIPRDDVKRSHYICIFFGFGKADVSIDALGIQKIEYNLHIIYMRLEYSTSWISFIIYWNNLDRMIINACRFHTFLDTWHAPSIIECCL